MNSETPSNIDREYKHEVQSPISKSIDGAEKKNIQQRMKREGSVDRSMTVSISLQTFKINHLFFELFKFVCRNK